MCQAKRSESQHTDEFNPQLIRSKEHLLCQATLSALHFTGFQRRLVPKWDHDKKRPSSGPWDESAYISMHRDEPSQISAVLLQNGLCLPRCTIAFSASGETSPQSPAKLYITASHYSLRARARCSLREHWPIFCPDDHSIQARGVWGSNEWCISRRNY